MSAEPPPPQLPRPALLPRMGSGVCWSDVVAEMQKEQWERETSQPAQEAEAA